MRARILRQCAVHLLLLGGVLGVTSVEALSALRDDATPQAQKGPLVASPATAHGTVNFVEIDLNFDGRKDLAVVQRDGLTAKPEVIYFLYDEAQKRFTRNQALGDLFSPEFDAHAKQVRTGWRQSGNLKDLRSFRLEQQSLDAVGAQGTQSQNSGMPRHAICLDQ